MCVRTLMGNETSEPSAPADSKRRLHEETLGQEEEEEDLLRQQERAQNLPDLADHVLAISTVCYSLLLKKLVKYYEVVCRSKVFK